MSYKILNRRIPVWNGIWGHEMESLTRAPTECNSKAEGLIYRRPRRSWPTCQEPLPILKPKDTRTAGLQSGSPSANSLPRKTCPQALRGLGCQSLLHAFPKLQFLCNWVPPVNSSSGHWSLPHLPLSLDWEFCICHGPNAHHLGLTYKVWKVYRTRSS